MFGLDTDLVRVCPCIYKCIAITGQQVKSGIVCIFLHHFAGMTIFLSGKLAVAGLIEA
jgi:hypothetical protein